MIHGLQNTVLKCLVCSGDKNVYSLVFCSVINISRIISQMWVFVVFHGWIKFFPVNQLKDTPPGNEPSKLVILLFDHF